MTKFYKLFCLSVFAFLSIITVNAQQNPTLKVIVTAPASLAGSYNAVSGGFGATLKVGEAVTGKLVGVQDASANPDLGCNELTNGAAISGNIALIRRGDCEFGVKCKNAEDKGAKAAVIFNRVTGGPVGMAPGAVGGTVTIPVCMISLEDGEKLLAAINAGTEVTMSFRIPTFFNAVGALAYSTPLAQSQAFSPSATFANSGSTNLTNLILKADILEPGGTKTSLSATVDMLEPSADTAVAIGLYEPTKPGSYTMYISNNKDQDTLTSMFELSKAKFALDNVDSDSDASVATGWVTLSAESFVTSGGRFDMGVFYAAGATDGNVAYAAFALNNIDSFPVGETFDVLLYRTAAAGEIVNGGATSYDDFTPVATAQFTRKASDTGQKLIFVQLEDIGGAPGAVKLEAEAQYLLVLKYENSNNSTTPPRFAYNSQVAYSYSSETVWTDMLYMGGFTGEYNIILRMYTNEFIVGTKDLPTFADHQVTVNPNPAVSFIKVGFNFDNTIAEVRTAIVDANGKVVSTKNYENVQSNDFVEDITRLTPGTYFYSVVTKEGWSVKPFMVVKGN